jgi:hypothetical protein
MWKKLILLACLIGCSVPSKSKQHKDIHVATIEMHDIAQAQSIFLSGCLMGYAYSMKTLYHIPLASINYSELEKTCEKIMQKVLHYKRVGSQ